MQVKLVMFKSNGDRKDFPLSKPKVVVGRKVNCDLRIPLSSVSRQHFAIEIGDDEVKLRDLGSSNGTYYNDERVMEATLAPGDQIRVGPVVFVVTIDGVPEPVEPIATRLPAAADNQVQPGEPDDMTAPVAEAADPGASDTGEAIAAAMLIDDDDDDDNSDPLGALEQFTADDDEDPIAALEALAGDDDDDASDVIPIFDDDDEEDLTK